MKCLKKIFSCLAALLVLTGSCALADISFNGTVAARTTCEVYAPIGGTVENVPVSVGQKVTADDVLATLKTAKVYASEDGTVTGIFGEPGDSAEIVAGRYGAVMYIEGDVKYTVAASTENAYNSTETKFIHVGEEVYLVSRTDSSRTGAGVVTSVEGTDYQVEVREGTFLLDETCDIYRSESAKANTRVGRGTVSRRNPTAVSGTGSIVSFAVKNGDAVKQGDLLFETLDGAFDGYYMSGISLYAGVSGTISTLNLQQGSPVQKNGVICVIYPDSALRVEAQVYEDDLGEIAVGDNVKIELSWNQDDEVEYDGVITMISAISSAAQGEGSAAFTVYIDFTGDENTRYGMSAVVTTIDPVEEAPEEALFEE